MAARRTRRDVRERKRGVELFPVAWPGPMKISDEFNYRHAREILQQIEPGLFKQIKSILNDSSFRIDLKSKGKRRRLSVQIQDQFVKRGWKKEQPCFSVPELKYDLLKFNIPIEVEIGHQRLVYADFFEFMADYTREEIPLGIIIATTNPIEFGHDWHNSVASTKRKIAAISEAFPVPVWTLGISP